jgi:ankyrin repeat protein
MKLFSSMFLAVIFLARAVSASSDWVDISSQAPEIHEEKAESDNQKGIDDNLVHSKKAAAAVDPRSVEIKESTTLNEILPDEVVLKRTREQKVKSFKSRKMYDPRSQIPPRVLQQDLKKANNAHIPAVTYHSQYSLMLFRAIEKGDLGAVSSLLGLHADINFKFEPTGITPLMFALMNSHARIAQYLILKGANVQETSEQGVTALHIAAHNQDMEMVKLLLDSGADMYARDTSGMMPLDYLPPEKKAAIIVSRAYDPEALQEALWSFVGQNIAVGVNMAIDSGATTEDYNVAGNTPLIESVKLGHNEVATALLARGAVPIAVSKDNVMALDYAVLAGNKTLISILENACLDYELRNDVPRPVTRYAHLYIPQVATSSLNLKSQAQTDAQRATEGAPAASSKPKKVVRTMTLKPHTILPNALD